MTWRDKHRDPRPGDVQVVDGDAGMTRSEEELYITTHRRESRRARLARFVETEIVTRSVEVRHEQVRVEYEPIMTDAHQPATVAASPFGGGAQWMVLYDEEVVVTTRRVPRERVRLQTHTVIEDREVSDVLRKERIEVSGAGRDGVPGGGPDNMPRAPRGARAEKPTGRQTWPK